MPGIPTVTIDGKTARTARRRSARRSRRAPTSARAAPPSWSRARTSARPRTTRSSRSSGSESRRPAPSRLDSAIDRSYHPRMPMWRCPHCGTPQAETARCWVCHRSSTACATCQNFRRSVAAQLGYCGLDRERRPLRGDEIRACWEASTRPHRGRPGRRRAPRAAGLPPGRRWNPCSEARVRRGRRGAGQGTPAAGRRSAARAGRVGRPHASRAGVVTGRRRASRAGACGATPRSDPAPAVGRGRSSVYRPAGRVPSVTWSVIVAAVAQDLDVDRVARRELGEGRIERMLLVDDLVVDADDDVAVLDAGLVGRLARLDARDRVAVLVDAADQRPDVDGELLLIGDLAGDRHEVDAHVRPGQRLAGDRLVHDRAGDVDRDREADAVAVLRRSPC